MEYFEYHFHKDPLERLETQAYVLNCETQERVAFDAKSGRGVLKKRAAQVNPIGFIHDGMVESTRDRKHGGDVSA